MFWEGNAHEEALGIDRTCRALVGESRCRAGPRINRDVILVYEFTGEIVEVVYGVFY